MAASSEYYCIPLNIIKREDWGAIHVVSRRPFKYPLQFVLLTLSTKTEPCSNFEECSRTLRDMQDHDMNDQGLINIRYNFLLGGDGNIYEGRGWDAKPAITGAYSFSHGKYIHIACLGDYTNKLRPDAMYKAQWDLLREAVKKKVVKEDFVFL